MLECNIFHAHFFLDITTRDTPAIALFHRTPKQPRRNCARTIMMSLVTLLLTVTDVILAHNQSFASATTLGHDLSVFTRNVSENYAAVSIGHLNALSERVVHHATVRIGHAVAESSILRFARLTAASAG